MAVCSDADAEAMIGIRGAADAEELDLSNRFALLSTSLHPQKICSRSEAVWLAGASDLICGTSLASASFWSIDSSVALSLRRCSAPLSLRNTESIAAVVTALQSLRYLKHLDLSRNALSTLKKLRGLPLLETLNCASNTIAVC